MLAARFARSAAPTVISVLVVVPDAALAPPLLADVRAAGFRVAGESSWRTLVHDALSLSPDLVVGWAGVGDDRVFQATTLLEATGPRAVLLFTPDASAERMAQALESGVHAYVINGYAAQRLRPLGQLALARFSRDDARRQAHLELSRRFEERKLVDRAKGILMRHQQISEDEAFRLLRTASQQGNQRVGAVSQQVISTAHDALAINLAGQLRMLSQRMVKLYALLALGRDNTGAQHLLGQSVERIESNLDELRKAISRPTFGDLLDAVSAEWTPLKQALGEAPAVARLLALDARAEVFLARADDLTRHLQHAGLAPSLHVVNLAGRQRMLSQRLAKQALLAVALGAPEAAAQQASAAATLEAFEQAQAELKRLPLSPPELSALQAAAYQDWQALLAGAQTAATPAGRERLAQASEALLQRLEGLTALYERSMQVLTG